jgi:hypothetical protein
LVIHVLKNGNNHKTKKNLIAKINEIFCSRYKDSWGFSKSRTGSAQSNKSQMGAPGTQKRTQSNSPARGKQVIEILNLIFFNVFDNFQTDNER